MRLVSIPFPPIFLSDMSEVMASALLYSHASPAVRTLQRPAARKQAGQIQLGPREALVALSH
jgi:hypothetical protein